MPAYALAHQFPPAELHEEVYAYMERVQATLDPFGGTFLVHGQPVEVREGDWPGALVIIEFPAIEQARAWYDSPAYQAIVRMRADHIPGVVLLVDGVEPGHDSAAMAAGMRAAAQAAARTR
ncbi:DUF1330 domain-containing protein [Nonomuraea roseoviolacea subsp. roseoviolacea]|uniref:Uncharacterized protein (DUF1330 family) n=1 Tax=Nonomuraea roseoviolacea subsp. carminata TaxID=160689 RepID=A0ABT1KBU9_9ACTN|nr:DUF1330 domain-containing protein [Nonomuraea roseoviolacea]MCP2351485.1 uncharacterized protein (DUF1330 family) [Nonomuraea roseoviolacea subsp. carminata]